MRLNLPIFFWFLSFLFIIVLRNLCILQFCKDFLLFFLLNCSSFRYYIQVYDLFWVNFYVWYEVRVGFYHFLYRYSIEWINTIFWRLCFVSLAPLLGISWLYTLFLFLDSPLCFFYVYVYHFINTKLFWLL